MSSFSCSTAPINKQSGVTLVELAIVVLIGGLISVAAFNFAMPMFENAKTLETRNKLRIIEDALSAYAVANNRVPCPAVPRTNTTNPPYGFERGSGSGGATPASCGGNTRVDWHGMVPFRTLGLDETVAFDGWGRPFTYAISPAFGSDPKQTNLRVHARCRTADWFYEAGSTALAVKNVNPYKAAFCCPSMTAYAPASDLDLLDVNGNRLVSAARSGGSDDVDKPFDASMTPNKYPPFSEKTIAPVYVIISHGATGGGAYNTTTGTRSAILTAGSFEAENADESTSDAASRRYYVIDHRIARGRAYDDIAVWGTQDTLFASQGESCAFP